MVHAIDCVGVKTFRDAEIGCVGGCGAEILEGGFKVFVVRAVVCEPVGLVVAKGV
jgi:hypothetical protein